MSKRVTRKHWTDFDGVDAPEWLSEEQANLFCSLLNSYIPEQYGRIGCRYHMLNHFQGGLYFHLLNRPDEPKPITCHLCLRTIRDQEYLQDSEGPRHMCCPIT